MESRKITVVSTKNQKKSVIMSAATTLAELKVDLDNAGIDYDGMSFFEGTSKVELKNNESVLPHDVPYKGTTTNELVFMLTNTNKKIKSGAMTRAEAYAAIKANNLQNKVQVELGKNFTMCKTADLVLIIEQNTKKPAKNNPVQVVEAPKAENFSPCVDTQAREAIKMIANALWDEDIITDGQHARILNKVGGLLNNSEESEIASSYSDDEIDDMFADM